MDAPPTPSWLPLRARALPLDWLLLGLITLACVTLSLLQWQWTGELARAERVRLRSVAAEQTQRLAQAFDDALRANSAMLLPDEGEVIQDGPEKAHMEHYRAWLEQADSAWFRRIAVAVPEKGVMQLYRVDGGTWRKETWPKEWAYLEDAMRRRMHAEGRPPAPDAAGDLMEIPVFARRTREGGAELEWMILEVNRDYLREHLFPSLVARFLNPGGEAVFQATVLDPAGEVVYGLKQSTADARAELFPLNFGGGPGGGGRGRGGRGGGRVSRRWTLLTRHEAGSLDAAVAQARRRNVGIALALITVLGTAAWALVRYTARTRRLAQLQMEFVAGVSHDLRTPLAAIRGAAYNVRGGLLKQPEAVERYGEMILRNAEDLTGMIENLLAFAASKKRKDQGMHKPGPVEVEGLIYRAAASIEHALEAAGGVLDVDVGPRTPVAFGDAVALERMLRNLLDNAARHGAAGKWVGVTARQDGDWVEIRVSDRGPGVDPKEMPRIFEAFYSGEAARTNHVRGTGLGLSLVKETVEAHGGTVVAENIPAGGAQFVVRLPAAKREAVS